MVYGLSIVTYFRLHVRMLKFLLVITLTIAIPLMALYSKTKNHKNSQEDGFFSSYSFLNIRRATNICK